MARGDLAKADLARQIGERRLVRRPAPAVHQNDGQRAIALVVGALKAGACRLRIERPQHLALGGDPFVHLDDMAVERLGKHYVPREDVGPRLVADPQGVAEPGGDRQRHPLSLALEQGVGGDGRPHLDRVERAAARLARGSPRSRRRRHPRSAPDCRRGACARPAAPPAPGDDVGEGAAAVDREGRRRRSSPKAPSTAGKAEKRHERRNRLPRRGFGIAVIAPASPPAKQAMDGPEDISPRRWKRILIDTWKDAGEDNL